MAIRSALIRHMPNVQCVFRNDVDGYIRRSEMDRDGTWNVSPPVYSYVPSTLSAIKARLHRPHYGYEYH